jgi:hypothetical protein
MNQYRVSAVDQAETREAAVIRFAELVFAALNRMTRHSSGGVPDRPATAHPST